MKIQKPCYFYNTGGCFNVDGSKKSDEECKYLHIKVVQPLEKPQHLKPPCKYYHLRKECNNTFCVFGHSELSAERWQRYFPTHEYPGAQYTKTGHFTWINDNESRSSTPPPNNISNLKTAILLMLLETIK